MKYRIYISVLLALAIIAPPITAATSLFHAKHSKPKIGLVLSGGGARGAAHIGVLKVLERLHIPIDMIVGTSMGALVGGSYAAGLSAAELEQRMTAVDWNDLFNDDPPRHQWSARRKELSSNPTWNFTIGVHDGQLRLPKGAIAGQKVQLFFNDLTQGVETLNHFDQFPIQFRAVATNLENGQLAIFDRGSLPIAMRASMAVPGVFAPIEWNNQLYVDGGLVRNLPIDVARDLGADIIIAVNLGSGYLPREQLNNVVGITGQIIAILTEQNVQVSLQQLNPDRDILIVPDLTDVSSSDFNKAKQAIAAGIQAAEQMAPALAQLSLNTAEYAHWQQQRFGHHQSVQRVDEIKINGLHWVNPNVFKDLIAAQRQSYFRRSELDAAIQQVYGRGDFERISYRFERHNKTDLLIVDAVEKAWGPGYLSFGLGLASDNQGDSRFGLRATYDRTWLNANGAEWHTELTLGNAPSFYSEFYQPLRLHDDQFIASYLDYDLSPYSVYLDDQRIARYDVTRLRLGADIGTIWHDAELRAGVYYGRTATDLDTGSSQLPEGQYNESGIRTRILYDTLDSPGAPRSGLRFALETSTPLTAFGADNDAGGNYTRALFTATTARSFGVNTIATSIKLGSSFGAEMSYDNQFPFGGFLKGSGYANEQFRGNDIAFAAVSYYRQIASLPPPFGRGLYLGASLEAGWLSDSMVYDHSQDTEFLLTSEATRYGGSLFFGSDTWIGPAYFGLGLTSNGEHAFYVLFGRPE
ncbi:patatin-like phospholipase family protein [Rhodoferax sp. 4810]|uniref:Patatin-like phospholipase family protein n=1 Tax=Thiospirillum jenense TaxID=1653858 RepID=A0A839HD06_9GAMM|nr:patatin-like phospholipase family protein [Thiospirillum jenense]MBB1075415.1 patatin-like phospholipase family protein [Rhodoferax jenense]MBB1126793.1 patatin-like phospholipase family protein [Thiospirillum jenense]